VKARLGYPLVIVGDFTSDEGLKASVGSGVKTLDRVRLRANWRYRSEWLHKDASPVIDQMLSVLVLDGLVK